ncbi:MAG TPA: thioredoxin domain-containing protein [Bryobacteraceae bacterium]|jgi:protein-disulfide isomerase
MRNLVNEESQPAKLGCITSILLGAAAALALATGVGLHAMSQTAQTGAAAHKVAAHPAATALVAPVKTYGSKTAPITMEVFTDYQCPGCRALYDQALHAMIDSYVAAGKVYLVHHDFPLVRHQYSGQAARWANAAASVGQFSSVEPELYDNQDAWGADGDIGKFVEKAMPPSDFQRVQAIMKSCAMPAPQVREPGADPLANIGRTCPVDSYIAQDIKLGDGIPVDGTPTYIIYYKGRKLPAGSEIVSWPILKQFFDSLLNS